ncbi:hypothetical protein [Pseudoalteromonas sp. A22]|uniref:hypothetical protein n=1 Tax=Pseudoalteromonas sp. A22 TaxID=327511 RepID=UPI001BA7D8E2|nr:hypothetical protein [Pseudoalteromonas sp. A22]
MIGPPLAIALSSLLFPQAGPLLAVILFVIGSIWLVSQKDTEPKIEQSENQTRTSALANSTVKLLSLVLLALGVIVGAIDVLSIAFAQQQGIPIAASLVLSMYALGSCIAGLDLGS